MSIKKRPHLDAIRVAATPKSVFLRNEVINWNIKYPVDHWWRKKYNIPFGSKQHREMTFLNMAFEYLEFVEFRVLEIQRILKDKRDADIKNNELLSQSSDGKQILPMSKKEIAKEFDNLDLDQFNENEYHTKKN